LGWVKEKLKEVEIRMLAVGPEEIQWIEVMIGQCWDQLGPVGRKGNGDNVKVA
jgi:hypothetical protein